MLSTRQGGEANLELGFGWGFQWTCCGWTMPVAAGKLQAGILSDHLFAEADHAASRGSACSHEFVVLVAESLCCLVGCFVLWQPGVTALEMSMRVRCCCGVGLMPRVQGQRVGGCR